jgi:TonB family protein
MRVQCFLALSLAAILPGFAQQPASAGAVLPIGPREVFAAAAPFYEFTSPELKPWHLKAAYQLYDENGKPSEQGTFEYWWASAKVHRGTWMRSGATRTEWETGDGEFATDESGKRLEYFEEQLRSAFLSPLPEAYVLNSNSLRMELEPASPKNNNMRCIKIVPLPGVQPLGVLGSLNPSSTYCFDPVKPALIANTSFGEIVTVFNKIAIVQGKYLAREIEVLGINRKILTATVDEITPLTPSDQILTPSATAKIFKPEKDRQGTGVTVGQLLKKEQPVYPEIAKASHVSGTVILQGTIGLDGKIHDLRVVWTPSSILTSSAIKAVSHWKYRPDLLGGKPVEVETLVNVAYTLGK